jgi:hypothetical protein
MPGQQSPNDRCCGEPVAQSVEHVTFNHGVVGSNPAGLTNKIRGLSQSDQIRKLACVCTVSATALLLTGCTKSIGWTPILAGGMGVGSVLGLIRIVLWWMDKVTPSDFELRPSEKHRHWFDE